MDPISVVITDALAMVYAPLVVLLTLSQEVGQNLSSVAITLMDIVIVIIIAWFGIKIALSSSSDANDYIFSLIKMIIVWSVFYWLVNNYGDLIDYFYDGFDRLNRVVEQETARAIATHTGSVASADAGRADVSGTIGPAGDEPPGANSVRALGFFMDSYSKNIEQAEKLIDRQTQGVGRFGGGIGEALNGLWVKIKLNAMWFFVFAVMVFYMIIYAFMLVFINFMQAVVVAVGPLMIMTMLVPYISFIGDGWVRTVIMIGLMKLFLTIILSIFGGLLFTVTQSLDGIDEVMLTLPDPVCETVREPRPGPGGAGTYEYERCDPIPEDADVPTVNDISNAFSLMTILPLILTAVVGAFLMTKAPSLAEMVMQGRGLGSATVSTANSGARGGAAGATGTAAAARRGAARMVGK